ncbi:MAG: ABC transporter permease [Bacteroidota bacterium]
MMKIETNNKMKDWKKFKQNRLASRSVYVLIFIVLISLLAPIIANQKPLYIKYKGQLFFPAFSQKNSYEITDPTTGIVERLQLDICDWKHLKYDRVIFPPIPYSPGVEDYQNANYKGPFDEQEYKDNSDTIVPIPMKYHHFLGTNKRGEDVLSSIIHGAKTALMTGIFSMLIASFLGLFLGCISGYFGDRNLKSSRGSVIALTIGVFLAFYYSVSVRFYTLEDALATSPVLFLYEVFLSLILFFAICYLFHFIGSKLSINKFLKKSVEIPIDTIITKAIEILVSLPQIILIITIAAIAKRSMVNVVLIIGFTSWTGIARLTRAEFLRIREFEYIAAAKSLGYSQFRVIFRHAMPNAIGPAMVAISFGIAGAILIESSLSFLYIGVPMDTVSWGRLLAEGREQFSAWWLVVFPGICIFVTVTIYNLIGEGLRDAFDPKTR